jgi:hypothetical protein
MVLVLIAIMDPDHEAQKLTDSNPEHWCIGIVLQTT